jgi:hypothetical protein
MVDWTQVLVAWGPWIAPTLTAAGAIYFSWRNGRKADAIKNSVDDNTAVTQNAEKNVLDQMNGAMDARITKIVKAHTEPLAKAINQLTEQSKNIPQAVARQAADVAVDLARQHEKTGETSDAFVKGVEHGIEIGKQKERLAIEHEKDGR